MSPARRPSPTTLPASGSSLNPEGRHTCVRCPICATEACNVLEELGTYCQTMCAASEAMSAKEPAAKASRRRSAAA